MNQPIAEFVAAATVVVLAVLALQIATYREPEPKPEPPQPPSPGAYVCRITCEPLEDLGTEPVARRGR